MMGKDTFKILLMLGYTVIQQMLEGKEVDMKYLPVQRNLQARAPSLCQESSEVPE